MRVLMLSWEFPPHVVGGMGKHVMELAPALAADGVDVHIVTPLLRNGSRREQTPEGVHVHRIPAPAMEESSYQAFVRQTNLVLEEAAGLLRQEFGEFSLIHAHDWLVAEAAIAIKHAWRRPLIATFHATERGRQQGHLPGAASEQINALEWRLSYESWRLIACSRFMATQVADYFTTPLDKIDVVPNAVHIHPDPFETEAERRAFRGRYAADDELLVFNVGRVVFEKGVHILLEAWPIVLQSLPNARLLIAGIGAYLDDVRYRAATLGITDSVTFAGFLRDDERDRLYHTADAAVFPSLYEPFGIVALEAMAAGCPVVVSATGGLGEVIDLHETGITVFPNSAESLAWGITHTLRHPEWAAARAANALDITRVRYNWARVAIETRRVYQRVVDAWIESDWSAEA
jgi:glycosyltransferase involved in cell wall biosynthesis